MYQGFLWATSNRLSEQGHPLYMGKSINGMDTGHIVLPGHKELSWTGFLLLFLNLVNVAIGLSQSNSLPMEMTNKICLRKAFKKQKRYRVIYPFLYVPEIKHLGDFMSHRLQPDALILIALSSSFQPFPALHFPFSLGLVLNGDFWSRLCTSCIGSNSSSRCNGLDPENSAL